MIVTNSTLFPETVLTKPHRNSIQPPIITPYLMEEDLTASIVQQLSDSQPPFPN